MWPITFVNSGYGALQWLEALFIGLRTDQSELSVQINRLTYLLALTVLTVGCGDQEQALKIWEHAQSGLYDAAYSEDSRYAVMSTVEEGVHYWDLVKNKSLYKWRHDKNAENGIAHIDFSPDGKRVITADKKTYVIWDTVTGRALGYWKVDADILDVAISNGGKTVLLGLEDGRALHITQRTKRRLEVIAHRYEPVAAVDLSPDGRIALTGGNDSRAMVWDAGTGKEIASFEHRSRVTLLVLGRQMKRVFSADNYAGAFVWDMRTGKKIAKLDIKPRQYGLSTARFSLDGSKLVTGSPGRQVSVWDSHSGEQLNSWYARTRGNWPPKGATIQAVAFAEDERSVLAAASNGYGHRWVWSPSRN